MTNIGLFRKYIELYAKQHKAINQDMTVLVRQLNPGDNGLPIELYMLTHETRWIEHESVVSDIFDHLLSAIKYFELQVFELPASDDLNSLMQHTYEQATGNK